ncbi:hypothetical protein V6N13_041224 [Hibiscus sabdariffa]|uniref:Uncharacterized protein n=1 Tax=Hibiscus sabdariffa TaxID=183260 RepID=A0ABR2RAQ4_9ROSI
MGKSCNCELKGKQEMGSVAVHSQVRKIKQESEADWPIGQAEVKLRLRPAPAPAPHHYHLSRSPLGEWPAEKLVLVSEETEKKGECRDRNRWVGAGLSDS